MQLSSVEDFDVGGAIHVIANNQFGFMIYDQSYPLMIDDIS
jgi:2-oxoglutarate dehydrogenase complex dehydrogenase (E1) component-like enzyme